MPILDEEAEELIRMMRDLELPRRLVRSALDLIGHTEEFLSDLSKSGTAAAKRQVGERLGPIMLEILKDA